jgi:hypothetical protein
MFDGVLAAFNDGAQQCFMRMVQVACVSSASTARHFLSKACIQAARRALYELRVINIAYDN